MSSSYFGAQSPYQLYIIKMRWMVGCMFLLTLLLAGSLVLASYRPELLSARASGLQAGLTAAVPPPAPSAVKSIPVLTARFAIEPGTKLADDMFTEKEIPEELLPMGVVLAADRAELVGRYTRTAILPGLFVQRAEISATEPLTPFTIPSGYRAVTISVDARTGVEGFTKPSTSVDVLWVYDNPNTGGKSIATIVRSAKVVSLAGATQNQANGAQGDERATPRQGSFPITVLASERDAKAIQLASASGNLMLSLVGDDEVPSEVKSTDTIDTGDILRTKRPAETAGVCVARDPNTGTKEKFIFTNNRWLKD